MDRLNRFILIASVLLGSWLGMEAIHESGHVLGAWFTGGHVVRVVLHPLAISRTDVNPNPRPLIVVWAGPIFGVLSPLLLWGVAAALRCSGAFVLRFFAGFCLIANGAYIGTGSFGRIGDCGVMLGHGSPIWQLWLFGAATVPAGFFLWHRQAKFFGLGPNGNRVSRRAAFASLLAFIALFAAAWIIDGR